MRCESRCRTEQSWIPVTRRARGFRGAVMVYWERADRLGGWRGSEAGRHRKRQQGPSGRATRTPNASRGSIAACMPDTLTLRARSGENGKSGRDCGARSWERIFRYCPLFPIFCMARGTQSNTKGERECTFLLSFQSNWKLEVASCGSRAAGWVELNQVISRICG